MLKFLILLLKCLVAAMAIGVFAVGTVLAFIVGLIFCVLGGHRLSFRGW